MKKCIKCGAEQLDCFTRFQCPFCGGKLEQIEDLQDHWEFERSSGYAGYINIKTGEWIHNSEFIRRFKIGYTTEEVRKLISDFSKEFSLKHNLEFLPSFNFTMNWIKENIK